MSVFTLSLIFASLAALSLVVISAAGSLCSTFWRYLVRTTDIHLRYINRFEDARSLVAGYLFTMAAIAALLHFMALGLAMIMLFLCLALLLPRLMFRISVKWRVKQINSALPDALSQISAAMRAGATFQSALQSQAENNRSALEQELAIVLRECRVGVRMEEALENLAERNNSEEIDLLVSAATIAQEVGGNLSDTLQGLSDTIRRKIEMEGKIQSLTAQGRLQGHVVTAMPFVMLFGLVVVEPDITLPIFSSLLGWIVLFIMFMMLLAGGQMIRKIVSIDI